MVFFVRFQRQRRLAGASGELADHCAAFCYKGGGAPSKDPADGFCLIKSWKACIDRCGILSVVISYGIFSWNYFCMLAFWYSKASLILCQPQHVNTGETFLYSPVASRHRSIATHSSKQKWQTMKYEKMKPKKWSFRRWFPFSFRFHFQGNNIFRSSSLVLEEIWSTRCFRALHVLCLI